MKNKYPSYKMYKKGFPVKREWDSIKYSSSRFRMGFSSFWSLKTNWSGNQGETVASD
jgi:hypothetical protein